MSYNDYSEISNVQLKLAYKRQLTKIKNTIYNYVNSTHNYLQTLQRTENRL